MWHAILTFIFWRLCDGFEEKKKLVLRADCVFKCELKVRKIRKTSEIESMDHEDNATAGSLPLSHGCYGKSVLQEPVLQLRQGEKEVSVLGLETKSVISFFFLIIS